MKMRKSSITLAVMGAVALVFAGVQAAGATPSKPDYVTVAWTIPVMPDGDRSTWQHQAAIWPQDYALHIEGKSFDDIRAALDARGVECGTSVAFQLDKYPHKTAKKRGWLQEGAVLKSGDDHDVVIAWDWHVVTGPECVDPEPTPTPEPEVKEGAESSQTYVCDSPANGTAIKTTTRTEWVEVDGVRTWAEPVVTLDTVVDADCDYQHPEPEPTPEPDVEAAVATECLPTEGLNARGECVTPTFTG